MKIKLTTSGLPVGERTTKRAVDMDHARDIVAFTARGYNVTAVDEDGVWRLMCTGKSDALLVRPYKLSDDARLLDEPYPEWITSLTDMIAKLLPDDRWIANRPKETPHG